MVRLLGVSVASRSPSLTMAGRVASAAEHQRAIANQRHDLEAAAARHGWQVVATFQDAGIRGTKGREKASGPGQAAEGDCAP
jgi:hypothetical protein